MDFVVGLYVAWNAASWQSRSTTTGQDATCSKGRGGTGIQLPLLLRNKWYPVLHSCANICFSGSAAEKCQTCHLILIDKVGSQMCPNLGSWNWVSSWQTCRYVFLGDLVMQRPGCGDWIATIWWMVAILFPMGCKRTQVLSCHITAEFHGPFSFINLTRIMILCIVQEPSRISINETGSVSSVWDRPVD